MNGGTLHIMEIIMISNSKLKVMLCEEDLKQFELKAEQLDYSNTDTKRMFWDILSKAKHQTGFDTDGQRVLVQLYPSKEGGCEMFVTKIGALSTPEQPKKSSKKDKNDHDFDCSSNIRRNITYNAFSFKSTEDMLNVCRRLDAMGYIGESSAYINENGKMFLFLSDVNFDEFTPLDEFAFILEYATLENISNTALYFSEHGKQICERDAVSILSGL